jgi:hypothetical protein
VFSEQSVQVAQRLHRVEKHTLDDKDKKDAATASANAAQRYEARAQVTETMLSRHAAIKNPSKPAYSIMFATAGPGDVYLVHTQLHTLPVYRCSYLLFA